jgi:DNA primase
LRDPVPSDSLRAFLEAAATRYQQSLSADAVAYLLERGLTEQTIDYFRYGYVETPLPGHEHLRGCISIPYLSPSGEVGTIRFRQLGNSNGPKYMSMANDTPRLYNVSDLELPVTGMVLTEGEFDGAIIKQCGFPVVGAPGASSWQKVWNRLLVQYSVVYMPHDDDDAGREMAKAIASQLDNIRPIPMTGGDVNSFYLRHGISGITEKLTGKR